MDTLADAAQPSCPECEITMRDVRGGWKCPACGHLELAVAHVPPRFDGPSLPGG